MIQQVEDHTGGRRSSVAVFLRCGLVVALLVFPTPHTPAAQSNATVGKVIHDGVAVEFSMLSVGGDGSWTRPPRQGDEVVFRFRIADDATDTPLPGANPAAWLGLRPVGEAASADRCHEKVSTYLSGSILASAELDLNAYYVLALNDDASITVVDPLFGFGGSKLVAMIELPSPGEDWALSSDESTLFVSMPAIGRVGVVDTSDWLLVETIDVGGAPRRVGLQPDGRYLWVTGTAADERAGVSVVDVEERRLVRHVATGDGPHEVAFSDDNRHAFVANAGAGTVSIIDVRELRRVADVPAGRPVSIDFSPVGRMAYAADEEGGRVVVIDPERLAAVAEIAAAPGLGQIRFAPDRRFGLVVNPTRDELYVIDAAAIRIVQTAVVRDRPDQIAFTDELAYVRHLGDETILMVPLGELGQGGQQVRTVDFPGGQAPFGAGAAPSPAAGIVRAPGGNAVLLANPADRAIYFYSEGMAAPMGNLSNYSRQPRAVLVVDRSLEESAPGVYETVAKLRNPGVYDVVFFLDAPRVVHCFEVRVEPWSSAEEAAPGVYTMSFTPPDPGIYYRYVGVASAGLQLDNSRNSSQEAVERASGRGGSGPARRAS